LQVWAGCAVGIAIPFLVKLIPVFHASIALMRAS
jgi:hypothetical protein